MTTGALLTELAGILGVAEGDLPPVFRYAKPKVLKVSIHADLQARFPEADAERLAGWFAKWTSAPEYLRKTMLGRHRHSLDDGHEGFIGGGARRWARVQLGLESAASQVIGAQSPGLPGASPEPSTSVAEKV